MTCRFVDKKQTLTDKERENIKKKLSKLDRFFSDETEATVCFTEMKNDKKRVEITVLFSDIFYRSEIEDTDYLTAVEKAVDVIEGQIRKNKARLKKQLRDGAFDKYSSDLTQAVPLIARTKTFEVKEMDVEEAVMEMELLSHEFYIFKNITSGKLNVVYARKNGDYGLLVPEV